MVYDKAQGAWLSANHAMAVVDIYKATDSDALEVRLMYPVASPHVIVYEDKDGEYVTPEDSNNVNEQNPK